MRWPGRNINRTLGNMLAMVIGNNHKEWDLYLLQALLAYRTNINKSTGATPFSSPTRSQLVSSHLWGVYRTTPQEAGHIISTSQKETTTLAKTTSWWIWQKSLGKSWKEIEHGCLIQAHHVDFPQTRKPWDWAICHETKPLQHKLCHPVGSRS